MQVNIPAGVSKDFIYPYPGFKITSKGTRWGGHAINDADYTIYEKLLPEQRSVILTDYYTQALPISSSLPIYINDSNLIYNNAYADEFSDTADLINKKNFNNTINKIYSEALSGVSEDAYLFKLNKTDFPVLVGINDIKWPIGTFDSTKNLPITILNDACLPIKLGDTDPLATIPGAIAGSDFTNSDVIYKFNTRTGDPVEAAWLGSGSLQNLNTDSTISVYNSPATNCASYIDGPVQGSLATKIGPTEKISFVWMDQDTPADQVIFFRQHAADCPYLKNSPYDYYANQDYQNASPLNDLQGWTKCRCKSIHYSPIGHSGQKPTDFNGMADYLFADPQGLGSDFSFNSWIDTRGYNALTSPQFSFYHLDGNTGDNEVGWGSGFWKTGDGSQMILKTGRRYTYYRTSLRSDLATIATSNNEPYLVVNYPYKNIKGNYTNSNTIYDIVIVIDKSYSETNRIQNIIQSVKQFVNGIITNSTIDVQISIVSFAKDSSVVSYLTNDLNTLNYNIDNIIIPSKYPDYETDIYDALQLADAVLTTTIVDNNQPRSLYDLCNHLNSTILKAGTFITNRNIPRSLSTKSIILFSDGFENINVGKAVPYSNLLKNSGVEIYAVDIGVNSYFNTNMQQIASDSDFFNLEVYLNNNDGDINSFVQYLISRFSGDKLSIVPTWYKATRDTNGNWASTTQISDMILNPGDYLSYVHKADAAYSGPNNTSFSTPAISFAFNMKLDGWDYSTNTFNANNFGLNYGGKPFWGKAYTTPQTDPDAHFDKGTMEFGGQVRFIDGYVPIHQPEVSDMVLTNGSYLTYKRRGNTNLVWTQPLTFNVSISTYSWNKINFYKDISNLSDMFRNGNDLDAIAYSSPEPSDIILESYSSFLPAKYNYYARQDFTYTEDLYYTNKCLTSFVQFNTGVAIEANAPHANLDNIHFPTVATVSLPSLATSEKETGEYLLPEKLGVSYYRGRGYSMNVSGDTLSFIDSISAERMFLNPDKYGPRHRGLTKNDQYSPVVISDIDSRWMMQSYSSSSAAGTITDVQNNQKFTPYQSQYEIFKKNTVGVSRQDDDFEFWTNTDPGVWNKPEKYPLTFRNELLASSYQNRKIELLVNKGLVYEWKNDIFGNDYALLKIPGVSAQAPHIKAVNFDTNINQINTIDLGCGGDFVGTFTTLSAVSAGGVTKKGINTPIAFEGGGSGLDTNTSLILPPIKNIITNTTSFNNRPIQDDDSIAFCNSPKKSPDYNWSESGYSPYVWCTPTLVGSKSFENPLGVPANLYICGNVDDDVYVNGEMIVGASPFGDCNPPLNGAHGFSYRMAVNAGEVTVISYYNNFTATTHIDVSLYYIPI